MMYPQLQFPMLPWNPELQKDSQTGSRRDRLGRRDMDMSSRHRTVHRRILHALELWSGDRYKLGKYILPSPAHVLSSVTQWVVAYSVFISRVRGGCFCNCQIHSEFWGKHYCHHLCDIPTPKQELFSETFSIKFEDQQRLEKRHNFHAYFLAFKQGSQLRLSM